VWFSGKTNNYITPKDFFKHQYGSVALGKHCRDCHAGIHTAIPPDPADGGAYLIEVASGGIIQL